VEFEGETLFYRVVQFFYEHLDLWNMLVSVTNPGQLASAHKLYPNYPNPFNPQTTITFSLDRPQRAKIAVYDLTGKLLGVLADRACDAGNHSVVWHGNDAMGRAVPSGTYVIRLETDSAAQSRKVLLLR